jgi:hypothetical protein
MSRQNEQNAVHQWQPDATDPISGRRTVYRGPQRGMVPQIGRPPAVNAAGQTQSQINAGTYLNPSAVQWDAQFPNLPNGQPRTTTTRDTPFTHPAPNIDPGITPQEGRFGPPADIDPGMTRAGIAPVTAAPQAAPVTPYARAAAPNTQPQAPNAGGSISTQYGTASVKSAPSVAPDWQAQIIAAHPQIGVKGSPENAAFVARFNAHGAPERGMQDAQEVMKQFAPQANPSGNIAHNDIQGRTEQLPGMVNERDPNLPPEQPSIVPPSPHQAASTSASPRVGAPNNQPPMPAGIARSGAPNNMPKPLPRDSFGHEIPAWKDNFNSAVSNGIGAVGAQLGKAAGAVNNFSRAPIGAAAGLIDQNVSGGPTIARGLAKLGGVPVPPRKRKPGEVDPYAMN